MEALTFIAVYFDNEANKNEQMERLPLIETDRLMLRALEVEDSLALFDYFSKELVMQYYDLSPFKSIEEAIEMINTWHKRTERGEGYRWGITLKDSTVIGTCGFHNISKEHNRAELGYDLHPDYWGKGIATEACAALIEHGFEQLQYHRIEAYIDPLHTASRRVLHKVGMKTEGCLRDYFFEKGEFVDAEILSIINNYDNVR